MKTLIVITVLLASNFKFYLQNRESIRNNGSFYGNDICINELSECLISNEIDSLGNTNMLHYFNNLTNNFGNNADTNATCGYVALAMVLNYYDTFYNDNIVEEKYEVNVNYQGPRLILSSSESPGTLYEQDSGLPYNSVNAYLSYLRNNYVNSSLHAKLVLIGTNSLNSSNFPSNTTYWSALGMDYSKFSYTVGQYFSSHPYSFSYTIRAEFKEYNLEMDYENVFDFIDAELASGRPVLVGFGQHMRVIYHKANNIYYSHDGYKDIGTRNRLVQFNKSTIVGILQNNVIQETFCAMTIEFNNLNSVNAYHYHSVLYNDDNTYNENFINHQNHYYLYNYEDYTVNKHKSYCKCSLYIQEQHAYLVNIHYPNEYCLCGRSNPFYV